MYSIDGKARLSTVNYVILDRIRKNAGGFQYWRYVTSEKDVFLVFGDLSAKARNFAIFVFIILV